MCCLFAIGRDYPPRMTHQCAVVRTLGKAPLIAMLAAVIGISLAMWPRVALACSGTRDPLTDAVAVVVGRVVRMELAPDITSGGTTGMASVRLTLDVDRYLLGSGSRAVRVVDSSSVSFLDGQSAVQRANFEGAQYLGASGGCGALTADPRGRYVVWALFPPLPGETDARVHIYGNLAPLSDRADDPAIVAGIEQARGRLAGLAQGSPAGVPRPAATGQGVPDRAASPGDAAVIAVAALVLLGIGRRATCPGAA